MPEYQNLTDDEVLQIATAREQLTDEARLALDFELTWRSLSIKDVSSQKISYERAEKLERARLGHRILSQRTFTHPDSESASSERATGGATLPGISKSTRRPNGS